MPSYEHAVLSNGTALYLIPSETKDIVTITLALRIGSTHDEIPGEVSCAMQMLKQGTHTLDANAFAEEVERRGCWLRASSNHDSSNLQITGLAEWFDDAAQFIADCLTSPRYDAEEFDKLRSRIVADLMIEMKDADWLAARAASQGAYGDHPYARSKDGTPASLATLTVDHLRSVHHKIVRAPRTIVVAGSVTMQHAVEVLERCFGKLPPSAPLPEAARPQQMSRIGVIASHDEAVQTAFRIIVPSVPMEHPDYAAVQLIATVLGGYTLARLFTILREEKGYTYGAYAFSNVRVLDSALIISTSVGNEFTADTMATIAHELKRLSTELIPTEELENARQHILGSFARSCETPQQAAWLLYTILQFNLPFDHYERYIERIQAFTPETLLDVQRRIFGADAVVIGAGGVRSVIEPAIAPFAAVIESWNSDGY